MTDSQGFPRDFTAANPAQTQPPLRNVTGRKSV